VRGDGPMAAHMRHAFQSEKALSNIAPDGRRKMVIKNGVLDTEGLMDENGYR